MVAGDRSNPRTRRISDDGASLRRHIITTSCANFALRRTAENNRHAFSQEAVDTVRKNFYVGKPKAVVLVDELRQLLAKGGFRLTKWISNSRNVLDTVWASERAGTVQDLLLDRLPMERALGVRWDEESDTFDFTITIKDKPPTKRSILSVVSSVYDPLGFFAPFILPAKSLLQDLCNFGEISSSQLHHFADASQHAYGAVTYLRLTNTEGGVHCSFVIGKSRPLPLRQLTISRLKVSAAGVATRLDKKIRKEIGIPIDEITLWTGSTCVLGHIRIKDKRFHTFVANRAAAIQEVTSPLQWRHVGTKKNPANDASRGPMAENLLKNERWLKGPKFLWRRPGLISNLLPHPSQSTTRKSRRIARCSSQMQQIRQEQSITSSSASLYGIA